MGRQKQLDDLENALAILDRVRDSIDDNDTVEFDLDNLASEVENKAIELESEWEDQCEQFEVE